MQTFLTHLGYNKSLQSLDDLRLSQQRVDAKQLLMILGDLSPGYEHHPAVPMWKGWEFALCMYGAAACYQWRIVRKNKCSLYPWFSSQAEWWASPVNRQKFEPIHRVTAPFPPWCKDLNLLRSHRSNLIRKAHPYYGKMWPNTPLDMPYLWPVNDAAEPKGYRLVISMADAARIRTGQRMIPDFLVYDETNREVKEK